MKQQNKTNGRFAAKVISLLLVLLLLTGVMGVSMMTAYAADAGVTISGDYLYANGIPIVIEAREDAAPGVCVKWTYNGVDYEQNMSRYAFIFGGTESSDFTGNTSITLNGGNCYGILGGNEGTSTTPTTMTGNSFIYLNGGSVTNVAGGGFYGNVIGNTYIEINGGDHGDVGAGSVYGAVTGNVTIKMNVGTVNNLSGGGERGTIDGAVSLIVGGGEVEKQLYGGSALQGVSTDADINISVGGDAVVNELIGGSGYGDVGDVKIEIGGDAQINELLAAGINGEVAGNIDVTVGDNASIDLLNGTQGSSGAVGGDVNIVLKDNATLNEVNGSENTSGVAGDVTITVAGDAAITGNLTGASEETSVGGEVEIILASESAVGGEVVTAPEGVAGNVAPVRIAENKDTEVKANANASYIIEIPESVNFGTINRGMALQSKDFYVAISDALFDYGAKVTVDVSSDFSMKNAADSTKTLAYKLFNDVAMTSEIATETNYCTFAMENAAAGETLIDEATFAAQVDGKLLTNPAELRRAGAYSDTMVFVCEYVPAA